MNDRLYVRAVTPESQLYSDRTGVTLYPVGDLRELIQENEPTKLLALSLNADHIDSLYTHLRTQYSPAELYLTKSIATFFEATTAMAFDLFAKAKVDVAVIETGLGGRLC